MENGAREKRCAGSSIFHRRGEDRTKRRYGGGELEREKAVERRNVQAGGGPRAAWKVRGGRWGEGAANAAACLSRMCVGHRNLYNWAHYSELKHECSE